MMKKIYTTLLSIGFIGLFISCSETKFGFQTLSFTRDGVNTSPDAPVEVVATVPVDSDGDGIPDSIDDDDDNDGNVDPVNTPPPDVTVTTQQETWALSSTPQTSKLGVVMVIDTSGSMLNDGPAAAAAMADLGKTMSEAGFADTCFAVAKGIVGGADAGKLYEGPHGVSLCVNDYSAAELATKISETFTSITYNGGNEGEAPDFAIYKMVTDSNIINHNITVSGGKIFANDRANAFLVMTDENSMRGARSGTHMGQTYTFTVEGNVSVNSESGEPMVRATYMSTALGGGLYETWFNTQTLVQSLQNFYGPISIVYNGILDTPGSANAFHHEADIAALGGLAFNINDLRSDPTAFSTVIKDQLAQQIITSLTWAEVFDVAHDVCAKLAYKVEVDGVDKTANSQRIGARRFHVDPPHNQGSSLKITYVKASDPLCPP